MKYDYAERARALIGTRFRPQGRTSEGLDCIGVVAAAYCIEPTGVPRNYCIRGDHQSELEGRLNVHFRRVAASQVRPGDLMLMRVAADQVHVGVRTAAGFVHAHAGIRRVVETPGLPEWPVVRVYRRRRR